MQAHAPGNARYGSKSELVPLDERPGLGHYAQCPYTQTPTPVNMLMATATHPNLKLPKSATKLQLSNSLPIGDAQKCKRYL